MLGRLAALGLLCLTLLACGTEEHAPASANPEDLAAVRSILANHLGLKPETIQPSDTFTDLGADTLDIVEVTMAIEDELGISISDEAVNQVAGGHDINDLPDRLTVSNFVSVVTHSRTAP